MGSRGIVFLLCVVAVLGMPELDLVSRLKESKAWQKANAKMRSDRIKAGLSPEVVPHSKYVRMRDGTLLWTTYWDPRIDPIKSAPTVLIRSPYGIFGSQNMADLYLPFGFVAVEQNQRGTGESEGDFCFWMTALFDGSDTMNWIKEQEFSNGQVFQVGASADGILSLLDLKIPQPVLSGQWLIITSSAPYSTLMQNNQGFREGLTKAWLAVMQLSRPDYPANTYYDIAMKNEGYNASYLPPGFHCDRKAFSWPDISMVGEDFKNVNFPAIHTGGWYDIFLAPQIRTFNNYDKNSSIGGLGNQQIFLDPRGHCFFETEVSFPNDRYGMVWSYEKSLDLFKERTKLVSRKSMPPAPSEMNLIGTELLKYNLYVMGPDTKYYDVEKKKAAEDVKGMYWTTLATMPAPTDIKLYFSGNNAFSLSAPGGNEVLSYVYDPMKPTPTIGGNNLFLRCGPANNLPNDMRSDNIYFDYQFPDSDFAVLGPIVVNLRVMTSANDTDFVVRISDLYPNGKTSMLLGDNLVRMKWRESKVTESKTVPNTAYDIQLIMWDICYVFNEGHKMRVSITSSNYPRYTINLNNDKLQYEGGEAVTATNSVFLGEHSYVSVPTVALSQLPEVKIF